MCFFNTKLNNLLSSVNNKYYYTVNQQLEIFTFGYQLNNNKKDFLSFGFYDGILYHPKDLITLAYEGNQDFSKRFNLSVFNITSRVNTG